MASNFTISLIVESNKGMTSLKNFEKQVNRTSTSIGRSSASLRNNAAASNQAAFATNRFAKGALQQAGYQVGDYAVQVANGTSAIQAFGQQGSQLLGIFGPIGAVLGAVVAIASAVGVAYQKSAKRAKELNEANDDLLSSYRKYQSAVSEANNPYDNLIKKFGSATEAGRRFLVQQQELSRIIAEGELAKALTGVQAGLEIVGKQTLADLSIAASLIQRLESGRAATLLDRLEDPRVKGTVFEEKQVIDLLTEQAEIVERLKKEYGGTEEQVVAYMMATQALADAKGLRQQSDAVSNLIDVYSALATESDGFDENEKKRLENLFDLQQSIEFQRASMQDFSSATEEAAENAETLAQQLERVSRVHLGDLQKLQLLQAEVAGRQAGLTESQIQVTLAGMRAEMEAINEGITHPIALERHVTTAKNLEAAFQAATAANNELKDAAKKTEEATGLITLFGQEFEVAKDSVKGLATTIDTQMEQAFMSIYDGTKSTEEAFKSMASAIIRDLYNVLVVQRLVGSARSIYNDGKLVTPQSGLAGQIGKAFGFRAMGGPVTAGRPYIVGERGPELMVPNRGGQVIPSGDLGGGVTVVQNFSIAANGDDSVKRIVMQQAPQIANMAKSAVIDARRRGGQMKAAFG